MGNIARDERGPSGEPIVNWRPKTIAATGVIQAAVLTALVLGSVVSFGGAVWWYFPAVVSLAFLLVCTRLVQLLAEGRVPVLKSPIAGLGLLALALAVAQSVPLPASLARRISPVAHEVYATGGWSKLVQADDPQAELPEPAPVRSPATLDRSATLRWLLGAAVCLAVFWSVSHYVDRLGRLYWVCGTVLAGFVVNTALGVVQIGGLADGLFGFIQPGRAPAWGPSLDDLLASPAPVALRRLSVSRSTAPEKTLEPIAAVPDRPFLFGTMMGGPAGLLAVGSMALPLALAIVLHLLAPRGSREDLAYRLGHSGQGGLVVLLVVVLAAGAFLAGMMAGPWFSIAFAVALALVGLPCARLPGSRWSSIGLTLLVLAALGLGVAALAAWPVVFGMQPPFAPVSWESVRQVWTESQLIVREFARFGTGFGSFETIFAYFKTQDLSPGFAGSSLVRWAVEGGLAAVALLALAALWFVCRLPGSLRRVGTSDRALAYGLIGAAVGLGLWSALHAAFELPAVAISASAVCGTWNRWLAGGTDLFVERV
jgi:hypothetical protein